MTTSPAVADVANKSVTFEGTAYTIQELGAPCALEDDAACSTDGKTILQCKGGKFTLIKGLEIDEYSKGKIALTLKELTDEAEAVKDML